MDAALAIVDETQEIEPARPVQIWRERPVTDDVMFKATDECGRSGWFLRLTISGLYPRRVGPYETKTEALNVLEHFLTEVCLETLLDLENDTTAPQVIVIEGVPRLVGASEEPLQGVHEL
jgi:hypothetical protein